MSQSSVPTSTQVLVIGGGPAGSYCASLLAREGISVVVLEASTFPRYHIGESLLPSIRPFLSYAGLEEKVAAHGFCPKPGAAVKFQQFKREGYTDFMALANGGAPAWNVVRSEFDDIIFRHAAEMGASTFENHRVTKLEFTGNDPNGRPVSAEYDGPLGSRGTISFDYLVDASGRAGIVSTKYLKNRKMNPTLKNIASWGYWSGTKRYMPGTERDNAPYFEALIDGSGWAWFIPLHNQKVSVGVVVEQSIDTRKRKESAMNEHRSTKEHYLLQLQLAPNVYGFLEEASLVDIDLAECVRSASDYSYAADRYSGDHFRLVGDASAFIDPFFSSGVHLAFLGSLSAAASISASLFKTCSEVEASEFHDKQVGTAYTRFLLVVLSVYKQIRNQDLHILADVDEDNFDRAFGLLRPVIQGTADLGKRLDEDELQKTMEFCKHIFAPTDPEMHEAVGARLGPDLCSPTAPILGSEAVDALLSPDDHSAKVVLREINARKAIHTMYTGPLHVASESINGMVVNLKIGSLGLTRV